MTKDKIFIIDIFMNRYCDLTIGYDNAPTYIY